MDQALIFVISGLKDAKYHNGVLLAKFLCGCIKLSVPIIGAFAAMKAPVAAAFGAFSSLKEGARHGSDIAKTGINSVKKVGSSLGVDTAIESFRKDPEVKQKEIQEKRENRRFHLNDTAPFMAYGVQKAIGKFQKKPLSTSDYLGYKPDNSDSQKSSDFKTFKQNLETKKETRKVIKMNEKRRVSKKSEVSVNNSSNVTGASSVSVDKKESLKPEFQKAFNDVKKIKGVDSERLGEWVWAKDTTGKNEQKLRDLGFEYSSEKSRWYIGPKDKKYERKNHTYDDLQKFYQKDLKG